MDIDKIGRGVVNDRVSVEVPTPDSRERMIDQRNLVQAVKRVNEARFPSDESKSQMRVTRNEHGEQVIQVVSRSSNEVLYEMPPESVLEYDRNLRQQQEKQAELAERGVTA